MALVDKYTKEELEQIVKQSNSIKEVIDKLGYTTHSGRNSQTVKNRLIKYNIDFSHFSYQGREKRNEENVFIKNSTASQNTLRRFYKKQKNIAYECTICG